MAASFVCRATMRLVWRLCTPPERTVIVGGQLAEAARHRLKLFADMHVELVEPREGLTLDELRDSPAWIAAADRVIVALPAIDQELLGELVGVCRRERTKLSVIPPAQGMIGTAVQMNHVADLPMMEFHTWDISRSTLLLKRSLDIAVATVGLFLLAPLFVAHPPRDSSRFARKGLLRADPRGQGWAPVPHVQVPDDGAGCGGAGSADLVFSTLSTARCSSLRRTRARPASVVFSVKPVSMNCLSS